MGHHHGHHHHGTKNLRIAFFLNLSFTIVEIVGGILTNSLAILSDALHDLGDSLSIGLSWYFQKLSIREGDRTFSYGYRRFSLLGAIVNSMVLLTGSVFILLEAIPALLDPGEANAKGMLVLAVFGVLVNGAAALNLKRGVSLNEKVITLHLLEDVLGWVAVLIGSLVMMFWEVPIIDPLLSVLIAAFIIYNAVKNLRKGFGIILQAIPQGVDIEAIQRKLQNLTEVEGIHDCHVWSMDGEYHVLSVHLVLGQAYHLSEVADIKRRAKALLKDQSIHHVTIEFELPEENCQAGR